METDPVIEGLFAEFNMAFIAFMQGDTDKLAELIPDDATRDACTVLLDIGASARTGYVALRHKQMERQPEIGPSAFKGDRD